MTKEEAIDKLQDLWNEVYNEDSDGYDYAVAIDMAIEALSKPNYETDTEVRLAVTNRKKEKVILWDAFGEVEYYPHGDMYCPNCGARLVPENEYLEPTPTHGRLIDADALSRKLCETTIFIKNGEVFQRMINDAPTVSVVDITQRDLCEDISCTDCPFMKETCKLMDYVTYADRPHGEWKATAEDVRGIDVCGADMRKEKP